MNIHKRRTEARQPGITANGNSNQQFLVFDLYLGAVTTTPRSTLQLHMLHRDSLHLSDITAYMQMRVGDRVLYDCSERGPADVPARPDRALNADSRLPQFLCRSSLKGLRNCGYYSLPNCLAKRHPMSHGA